MATTKGALSNKTHRTVLFGTKAQTLIQLRPLLQHARILPAYFFEVRAWAQSHQTVLETIQTHFPNQRLIVRSSTLTEDSEEQSYAGAFHSVLCVESQSTPELRQAIEKVIASYPGNPLDQVLVQPMLEEITVSGVMTTHTLNDGAPYYVINYDDESGKTDTITGGLGVNKTVLIHHQTDPAMLESSRVAQWVQLIRELEAFFPQTPLDIEFAQTRNGTLYLLQVRPLTVQKYWNPKVHQSISDAQAYIQRFIAEQSKRRANLLGIKTFLGEMTDWNPAEMIGTSPRPLAVSLYRSLITDRIWRKARAWMGYRHPEGEALMLLVGGRPYIDIRNSFNSFLPANLEDKIAEKIVNAWLNRLEAHPELHDKAEFEVAQTALDFSFEALYQERFPNCLSPSEYADFKAALTHLTQQCLDLSEAGTLHQALAHIRQLEEHQQAEPLKRLQRYSGHDLLYTVRRLLQDCQTLGTFSFAVIARHAFIAEALLRSAVTQGALSAERLQAFKASLVTITTQMSIDLQKYLAGDLSEVDFLNKYGHLRPGTYDILSLRYDQRPNLFTDVHCPQGIEAEKQPFILSTEETNALNQLIQESGLWISVPDLLSYCEQAITGREYAKFIFTRSLSCILELLAAWGEGVGLSREDMSFINLEQLLDTVVNPILADEKGYYQAMAAQGRQSLEVTRSLRLNYLIRDVRDVYVVPLHRSAPNFVTSCSLEAETVVLNHQEVGTIDLSHKIVCIENADPGFDWIFTRGIAGLITKFGGSNSHMAIRCAEFQIPAAIGCGEQLFEQLTRCHRIELHCGDKIVRALYG